MKESKNTIIKNFVEEVIEYMPDNLSAEYFTEDDTAWYSEEDIINYLKLMVDQYNS